MSSIHPTAIIEAGAKIDEDVQIGPYSIIGSRVTILSGSRLDAHVSVQGNTTIGHNNRLHFSCYLGGPPQHLNYNEKEEKEGLRSSLRIGNGNVFREFSQAHCSMPEGNETRIGDDNFLMAQCHVGHNASVGSHNILVQGVMIGGHCVIGDHINVAALTGVHQWVRIGSYSMLGSMSVANKDIPPYVMAQGERAEVYGLNSLGLRRTGFSAAERSLIKKMYQIYYVQERSHKRGLARLQTEIVPALQTQANTRNLQIASRFIDFLAAPSERSVIKSHRSASNKISQSANKVSEVSQ